MSEHNPRLEIHEHHEKPVDPEHQERIHEDIRAKAEKAAASSHEAGSENLKLLQEVAKKQAEARHNTPIDHEDDQEPDIFLGMQQSLKTTAYDRTLRSIRQKLPKPARLFSQAAHNKTIEAISETTAKTVARPSGLLGGSLCAFIGSLVLFYYSRHYGFTYNYALFLILFMGGFVVGAIIELSIWVVYRRKQGQY